jgi:hypothetical protein
VQEKGAYIHIGQYHKAFLSDWEVGTRSAGTLGLASMATGRLGASWDRYPSLYLLGHSRSLAGSAWHGSWEGGRMHMRVSCCRTWLVLCICIVGVAGVVGSEIQLTLDELGKYSEGVRETCIMISRLQRRSVYMIMACFVE